MASLPDLRRLYAKYKDQGVEFVGISLDHPGQGEQVRSVVADESLNWIQTYSGMGWQDPTAVRYGIEAIPSTWIVGRDGNVITDQGQGRLDSLLSEAVKQPYNPLAPRQTSTAPEAPQTGRPGQ
jgi:peroxiredoxin